MNRLKRKEADRPRAFWGALISAGVGIASALLNSKAQEKQRRLQANLEDYNNSLKEAQGMTNALNAGQDYQQNYLQQFKQQARLGTTRRLGSRNIMITDGGNAKRIGNNTYLLRGGSHEDINETGQTGIGINVGGNEIEAEGGEVAQRKGNSLRIYSAQPILGGMSPAQAIMRGYNKDKVFNAQQRFKKNNGIKDDGSKAQVGGYYGANYPSPLSLLSILYDKYPSVASKDFAGGNRSYPIPTKADAIDALRLAGLHGRSDVRSKVYSKYPELRKKAENGTSISLGSSYINNQDLLHRITQGHPTARKIINEIFGDEADRRRIMQDLNIFGLTSDDASSIAGASPIFRQPIVNAARQAQFIQNANKARQAANANKARQAANYAQQQVDYIKELSDRMSATIRNVGEQLGIRVNPNPNNSVRRLYSSNFKPTGTNNRITAPRETPISSSNSSMETPINSTTTSATNTPTYSGKSTKFNTKYRSYRNAGFSPRTSKNLVKANKLGLYSTIGGFGTIGAGTLIGANINKTDKTNKANKAQLDAKGKPISSYIARPQEPAKPQSKKSVPARKDTIAVKPATRQVPASIVRKDTTRTDTTRRDTTKQVNKVVKRQVRTTPQYTGNTTRGNYRLHDGETKIINGVKYTRRGNTIINHKTNVGYIYDKNGNYTDQADYSKVGNFNQAFDAARAAGRNQFIYRAGKYNNYSTIKETNAKKEALNRRIGARRIAKRMGCLTNPPVGSRKKYLPGGTANPWDKYKLPDYGGVSPWQISNKYDVNVPYPITKYDLPITTITAKKDTFNDEMSRRMRAGVQNLKDDSDSKTVIPYLGKQSSFKPTTQDYIGLGIDTLASLGIGLINSSAAGKTYLPERPAIIQASKLPTYYNVAPQVEEIKRQKDILNEEIANNTSSSVAALNRISRIRGTATGEINKLYATKENEENKMLTQDALNQQQVAVENAKLQADYETNKANILNAASQAKANALSGTLSGLSQAWNNFASTVENRYDSRQNEIAAISSSNSPSVVKNAISLGYDLSPEVLANLYKNSKNEELRNAILGRLSPNERKRYGIE